MGGRVIIAGTLAVLVAIGAAAVWLLVGTSGRGPVPGSIAVAGADIGGPFELTDTTGRRVTDAEVIDRPALIYFGYTFCPDVCPVDAARLADVVDLLAADGIEVRPVFITVDPARDTPESLGRFVSALHPKMWGLTGSEADVLAAAEAYRAYYTRTEAGDSAAGYLVQHTVFTYLMLPGNRIGALFSREATPEDMASEIRRVLG